MKITNYAALVILISSCACAGQVREAQQQSSRELNAVFLKQDLNVDEWVERFEKEGREIYDKRVEITALMSLQPGMEVADIGAGTGLFSPLMSAAVGPEGTVFAVDIAPNFLTRIDGFGLDNVETVLCDEHQTGLATASVDLAFICDTYHHFSFPTDTLASLHAAIKPGGHLMVVDFYRIEGESSEWIMNHVRAGEEVFTGEIVAAGFRLAARRDLLEQNYILDFERVD